MRFLRDFNFKDKRVLVRCDYNVPLDEKGNILDDFRIRQTIPTIEYLIKSKAKIILISHLKRPEGKVIESLRLFPIQKKLTEIFNLSVIKADDCVGKEIERFTRRMSPGQILLLENVRFHKEEEENEPEFAAGLARLGDVFINEAFSVSHRSHASVVGITKYLPSGAGLLMEKEIKILRELTFKPKKPLIAVIGGVKIETKTALIDKLSEMADWILIGDVLKKELEQKNVSLKYPRKIIKPLNDSLGGKDIGSETIKLFKEKISLAKTIFWNGPLGMIEKQEFCRGSTEIAKAIVASSAFSVIGGGETVEFVNKLGLADKFGYISTAGGSMLKFMSGEKLPGIEALEKQYPQVKSFYGNIEK